MRKTEQDVTRYCSNPPFVKKRANVPDVLVLGTQPWRKYMLMLTNIYLRSQPIVHLCSLSARYCGTTRYIHRMVKKVEVEGFEAFQKAAGENEGKEVFALFCGSPGADGNSWCPDCVVGKYSVKSRESDVQ